MIDICPQRIGHACFLKEEEWMRVKDSRIPVIISICSVYLVFFTNLASCISPHIQHVSQVEICLTSNIQSERLSSLSDHHFGLYLIFLSSMAYALLFHQTSDRIRLCSWALQRKPSSGTVHWWFWPFLNISVKRVPSCCLNIWCVNRHLY